MRQGHIRAAELLSLPASSALADGSFHQRNIPRSLILSIPKLPSAYLAALALLLLLTANAAAKTVHVPSDHAVLLAALEDTTLTHGDTILVAAGLYSGPGNRDLHYQGKDLVVLDRKSVV